MWWTVGSLPGHGVGALGAVNGEAEVEARGLCEWLARQLFSGQQPLWREPSLVHPCVQLSTRARCAISLQRNTFAAETARHRSLPALSHMTAASPAPHLTHESSATPRAIDILDLGTMADVPEAAAAVAAPATLATAGVGSEGGNKFQHAISAWRSMRSTDGLPEDGGLLLTIDDRRRPDDPDREPRQYGLGDRGLPAGLDRPAQGPGTKDKGLQEARRRHQADRDQGSSKRSSLCAASLDTRVC